MPKHVKVAIIGGGSAGLAAAREVQKVTADFLVINDGPSGTTCARVACMPSKSLIEIANDFHRRAHFSQRGITGGDQLTIDRAAVWRRVRTLRDHFVGGMLEVVSRLGDRYVNGRARFLEPNVLSIDGKETLRADRVIIATGSHPIIPKEWSAFRDRIITSDEIFEIEAPPASMAVVGLGYVGLELAQALHRLGVEVSGFERSRLLGGLTDPEVIHYAAGHLGKELSLTLGRHAEVELRGDRLRVFTPEKEVMVDMVVASLGRAPNLDSLDIENSGATLKGPKDIKDPKASRLDFNPQTMQVQDLPLFIAGDLDAYRPVLHEASDEGHIAGYNAARESITAFVRRAPLGITFSDPNIAFCGQRFSHLESERIAIGRGSYEDQGRALMGSRDAGCLHLYGEPKGGQLLGAELFAPGGEHLAHLLSWAIQKQMTVHEILQMPFYHPTVEEGLRGALRDLAEKCDAKANGPELATQSA